MDIAGIGIWAALAAGAVSFLSPCVLPLVPGYVSYIAGGAATAGGRASSPRLTSCRSLGASPPFTPARVHRA